MMPSLPYQPGARPPPVVWTDGAGPGEHEWDGLEVVRCVSEGVEVTVSTLLMPEEVVLRGSGVHFVWTYRVEMRLLDREGQLASGARKARDQVQLLSREWAIEDSSGAEVGRVACGEWVDGWTPGVCADVRPCFVS